VALALYRKYRPARFADVVGQGHVTEPLRIALKAGRINHAYLFSGPRGCGKTSSARILARSLNCVQGPTPDPCGVCASCVALAPEGPGNIDVVELDAASHGGVDDARELRDRAFYAPAESRYRVFIVDEAHMVTTQGFNALLKIVEEPPEHLVFVFATTEPEKVLPTIRSRTHHYPFRLIPPRTLSTYLSGLCDKEGVRIDPAALPLVVRAGGGSARDTLSVLDQLLGGAGPDGVTYDVATGLLGYTPDALLDEVVDAFAAADGSTVFAVVDKVIESGQDPRRFTEDVLRRLRDLVIIAAVPDASASGLIDVPEDQAERLVAQAARFGKSELVRAADLLAAGLTEMRGATAPRLLLEMICARVLLPGADHGTEGLAARLDRVERRISIGGMPVLSSERSERVEGPVLSSERVERVEQPAPSTAPAPMVEHRGSSTSTPPEPEARSEARPAVEQPRVVEPQPVAEPQAPVDPGGTRAAPSASSGLGLADVRRIWPDLLERIKTMRRFTWMLLSQNAQVVGVEGNVLTLGFKNAGARESFAGGGSDEILRQALIDMVGADWKVEAIIDPSAQPGASPPPRVTKPAVEPRMAAAPDPPAVPDTPPDWAASGESSPPRPPSPEIVAEERAKGAPRRAVAQAREGITATRRGALQESSAPTDDPDAEADRDDADADESGLQGAELLRRELGATVIEEIPHE